MRILLTNDDGIDAPGMAVLEKIAHEISDDVWTVAPQNNNSGAGHSLTFGREISYDQRTEKSFAVDGTPVDCVILALNKIVGERPALVLSGVNNGENVGDTVNCSGTIGAAREAALNGILGIALSQGSHYAADSPMNWSASADHGARIVEQVVGFANGSQTFFNVNFPRVDGSEVTGTHIVPHARFDSSLFTIFESDNAGKYFVGVDGRPGVDETHHDLTALYEHSAITVSPLQLQITDFEQLEHMRRHFETHSKDST